MVPVLYYIHVFLWQCLHTHPLKTKGIDAHNLSNQYHCTILDNQQEPRLDVLCFTFDIREINGWGPYQDSIISRIWLQL